MNAAKLDACHHSGNSFERLRARPNSGKSRLAVAASERAAGMHVLHVGKYYAPYRGGIETVVEQLCRGLVRRGLRVTALVSNDATRTERETLDGVEVIRLGRSGELASQPLNLGLVPALKTLSFDVLHFHTPNPLGALALLAARRSEPIVITHHSDIVRQRLLGTPATFAQSLLYERAAALVAATPRHIEYSRLLGKFSDRSHVIHFPIDAAPYAAAEAAWDPELPEAWRAKKLVLFVGRLVYYKGVEVLLDAMKLVDDAVLAIVGVGPLEPQLRERAARLGLLEQVRFLGGISEERLRSLYKVARFLVLPSVAPSEAFGMVQLEAMAAARPVISTNLRSGVPYVNQHGTTGLVVPPSDANALARAMRDLLGDEAYADSLGRNAQRRVLEEFDVDRVVEAHAELYASLARGAARSTL